MIERFNGFTAKALSFFRKLERNNTREWFPPRKAFYEEQVRAVMLRMVELLNKDLSLFAADHVMEPKKAVYRIYRDTRFSKDKTPYKTHIAAIFPRRGMAKHGGGGLYFSVSAKEIEVAGGVYMPGPEQLLAIRSHIAGHQSEF